MSEATKHSPLGELDAAVWVEEFLEAIHHNPAIAQDEGALLAWFAGAIETGRDAERPRFGRRVEDGGRMGTIVRCETCGGSGELHQPDELPPMVEPDGA